MDDFRPPNNEGLELYVQDTYTNPALQRPSGWPFFSGWRSQERNQDLTPDNGGRLGIPTDIQINAANLVANDVNLQARRIPRLWNPALRTVPSPFGSASAGVNYWDNPGSMVYLPVGKQSVLMKLNIFRQATIRALAGSANPKPAAGGGNVQVRIPSASTLGAF